MALSTRLRALATREGRPGTATLAANRVDRCTTRQALALFLVAPQALYAGNRHVEFRP